MDPQPHPRRDPLDGPRPSPVPVAAHDRRLDVAALVVVALVTLAILKPWAPSEPPAPGPASSRGVANPVGTLSSAASAASASAGSGSSPIPAAALSGALAFPCYLPTGWRLAVLDRELGMSVRTWVAAMPAASPPATTGAVRWIPFASGDPIALGFCAPAWGPEAAPWTGRRPRIEQAWHVGPAAGDAAWQRATVWSVGAAASRDLDAARVGDAGALAVLYQVSAASCSGPSPSACASGSAGFSGSASPAGSAGPAGSSGPAGSGGPVSTSGAWPAGRWVVALGSGDGPPSAWFGFVVGAAPAASR